MFIAALFTTAKTNNLSVHQQMMDKEDVAHTHTHVRTHTQHTHNTRAHTTHI